MPGLITRNMQLISLGVVGNYLTPLITSGTEANVQRAPFLVRADIDKAVVSLGWFSRSMQDVLLLSRAEAAFEDRLDSRLLKLCLEVRPVRFQFWLETFPTGQCSARGARYFTQKIVKLIRHYRSPFDMANATAASGSLPALLARALTSASVYFPPPVLRVSGA